MLKLYVTLQTMMSDRRGVTAIEYAVMAGAIAVALVAIMGNSTSGVMKALSDKLTGIIGSIPTNTTP